LEIIWTKNKTQYLNDLIKTPPKITLKFEVYHMEGGGQNGPNKVTDLVIEKPFIFSRWKDTTPDPQSLPLSNKIQYIRMKLIKNINFGDEATQNEFNRQWAELKAEGMAEAARFPRSKHSLCLVDSIDGFKPLIVSFLDSDNSLAVRPRWMKRRYYLLASLFGFTWFYRLAYNRCTQKTACRITKTVFNTVFLAV